MGKAFSVALGTLLVCGLAHAQVSGRPPGPVTMFKCTTMAVEREVFGYPPEPRESRTCAGPGPDCPVFEVARNDFIQAYADRYERREPTRPDARGRRGEIVFRVSKLDGSFTRETIHSNDVTPKWEGVTTHSGVCIVVEREAKF